MAPAPLRSRTVSCKVTEEEYERLVAAADRAKKSVGEWCREALVERTQGREPTAVEQAVLAEVLSLRTILLNVHYTVANGEQVTEARMREVIERAEGDKLAKAARRLAEVERALGRD